MAPKKRNAFYWFMADFKEKEKRRGHNIPWDQIATAASPYWKKLSPKEKEVFEKKAKECLVDASNISKPKKEREKYSSQGVALSLIEKENREKELKRDRMKNKIKRLVQESYLDNVIAEKPFYFIMADYFCKTDEGVYIPAELAILKFNFIDGVVNKYHTYLNPGIIPLGYGFTAIEHSNLTHRLPTPPNALGEANFHAVYMNIKRFIEMDRATNETPIVFTKETEIPMILSIMEQLSDETYSEYEFEIYPLEEIFFTLKEETGKYGKNGKTDVTTIHIARRLLDIDPYENRPEIACQFHVEKDATKHCALSCVTRWSYIFADHICKELDIELVPGKHLPHNADVTTVNSILDDEDMSSQITGLSSVLKNASGDSEPADDEEDAEGWTEWHKDKKQRGAKASLFNAVPKKTERWEQNKNDNKLNSWK